MSSRHLLSSFWIHSFTSIIPLRAFASSISFREFAVIPYIFPVFVSHFSHSRLRGHSISCLLSLYFLTKRFIPSFPVSPFAPSRPVFPFANSRRDFTFFLPSHPTFPLRSFVVILFPAFAAFTFLQKDSFLHFQYLPSCLRVWYTDRQIGV